MKKILQGSLVGLVAAVVGMGLWYFGVFDRWEYATWSLRVKFFARPGPATDRIKIILLDQASLDWGKNENGWSWPWPREVYGTILDFCRRGGARAVAFDVLYTEPSVYGVTDDTALGAAIKRSAPFVGALALSAKKSGAASWPKDIPAPGIEIAGLSALLHATRNSSPLLYASATFPIPEVYANAKLLANVIDSPDPDSVFRRAALFTVFDDRAVPSLGLAAYLAPLASRPEIRLGASALFVGNKKIPLDDSGRAILRFRGPLGVYRPLSAAAVIQSELRVQEGKKPTIDPATFKDCYIFFGFSAPGLLDLRATPLSPVAPGVLIHATVLDNLLSGDFLSDPPRTLFLIANLLLIVIAGAVVVLSKKAWQSVVIFIVFLPLLWLVGFAGYPAGFWWGIVGGEGALALALIGGLVLNYATEGRQKAFIKQAFKFYLSPEVIEQILVNPSQLKLGGERRELTLFFSDIEKFSTFSEKLDPPTLTALLNDFLSDMTDIILQEGGTLDKYIGDAIVAFWNAPVNQPDHALRAVRAAVRCQRKLNERREEFRQRTGVNLRMRIGLNTGEVVVGNMGSRERFNYTVLGDAANLASRLEGANKAFGTYLMAAESTWSKTGGQVPGRELGQLRVVGRKTPVRVFQPLGFEDESKLAPRDEHARGLKFCAGGQWASALSIFERYPDDPVAQAYSARCRALGENPRETWDGIWSLTEK